MELRETGKKTGGGRTADKMIILPLLSDQNGKRVNFILFNAKAVSSGQNPEAKD
jgi:hypothetical protein